MPLPQGLPWFGLRGDTCHLSICVGETVPAPERPGQSPAQTCPSAWDLLTMPVWWAGVSAPSQGLSIHLTWAPGTLC